MARHAMIDRFFYVFKTMISQMIRLSQYDKKNHIHLMCSAIVNRLIFNLIRISLCN